ncbi:hypothetical protein AAE02nite_11490 [Adhaeribacter aerolatus]|uniref:TonB C-terminal domain-containing protein n=1 Tax=Adhaeribacter aerolatus TaxID=670289 RepID=A0A512AUV7_9BACT|nr:M56 family metallopeptidase [Adhaeribacter aerolatus]GEO03485.1 hypothetical protein AAE02nite_11490 [Adhaeribacter aerolatus]
MNNLLLYLAESSLALLLFYAVYALLLSHQTCFTFNRFYLLAALLFSLVIPFLELPAWPPEPTLPTNTMVVQVQPAGVVYQTPIITATLTETETLNIGAWLYGMYATGVLIAIIFFCCQFLRLYTFIYSHAAAGYYWQRIKIIPTHGEMATFSFLHYILFDNSQPHTPAEKELILRHEQAHLAQKHTFDILYLKLLTIIFWFNPLLYFYKKALESTHEYLADAEVLQDEEVDTYATLLVQQVFNKTDSSFGNFFHLHQSLLLKRLNMMRKFKSHYSLIQPLLALPVICVIAGALAANRPVSVPDLMPTPSASEKTESSAFSNADKRNIFAQTVANSGTSDNEISEPSFPNGKEQLYRFLLQHLKFKPEEFGKDAVRGTVVSIKLDEEGNPENAFAENEDLVNQEINRVIRLMPRWIPAYQNGKGIPSRYELHFLINRNAKHSVITPNKLARNGALNSEGVPTFSSEIIHLGLNPNTGTPKNFENQEAIVVGEITEPNFPGGQAAMDNYFRENLNLGKVVGNELAKAKEFGLGSAFTLEIDQNGNIKKLPLEINGFAKMDLNLPPEKVNVKAVGNKFSNEVIRLINNMPQWSPATKDGKPISAKIMVGFGLRHSSQPSKPLKRDEVYSTTPEGKLIFQTDQIVFWIPYQNDNQKRDEGVQTIQEIKPPLFPGGEPELYKFLSKHIKYPTGGLELNDSFTWTMITVKIDKNGNPETYNKFIKDPFIKEAYRVKNLLPKFEPATKNGEPVTSDYIIPIYFRYSSDTTKIDDAKNQATFKITNGVPTAKSRPIVVTIYTDKSAPDKAINNIPNGDKTLKPIGNQKLPQFPGGKNGLREFLSSRIQFPATALKNKLSGQAILQATIDADGKVTNFKTLHTDNAYFEQEALSVLREMPRWEPALTEGKAVPFNLVFPFVFALESKQNIPALRLPANRSQLYVQDAITITGYSQVIPGKTFVKKESLPTPTNPKPQNPAQADDKVFTFVEQMATFPGGETALNNLIRQNLKYPAEALRQGVSGLVVAQFTVDKTGKIRNPQVVKSLGGGTDEEVLRLIKLMPNFSPARQNGKPVNFRYTIPIRFGLTATTPEPGTGAAPAPTMPDKVFTFVEVQPQFPGGTTALNEFIKKNLQYPAEAVTRKVEGLVVVQFVVDTTGKIMEPKVVKSLDPKLDEEALRVVKTMPEFQPARQNNRKVAFRYTMPFRFALPAEPMNNKKDK